MQTFTRQKFDAYMAQIASLNGVSTATTQFTVAPTVQQSLEKIMQDSSEFLGMINVVPVDAQVAGKVGIGVSSPIASRTDTKQKARDPKDPTAMRDDKYECVQTNFDTALPYQLLDAWAHRPEFQTLIRDSVVARQALDRIMIGMNGVTAEAQTDIEKNPLLQDVNVGWLQKYRNFAPQRVMSHGKNPGKIVVGAGGDYKNLDAVVYDAKSSLLDPWAKRDNRLVAIIGDQIEHDKFFPLINADNKPTEQNALDLIMSAKRIGSLQAASVPFVPPNCIFITLLKNISIYVQNGARRRYLKDEPERNRVSNFESSNEAYVVEDYGYGCLVENIEFAE